MGFVIKSTTPLMDFSDDDVDKILTKYDRNLHMAQEDVGIIKNWICNQKHLPCTPPDQQIFIFLVMSKFSIEKTKEKLDMYYTIRTLIPDYYNNLLPSSPQLREMQKIINLATLPKLSKNLNRVIVFKVADSSNPNFSSSAMHTYLLLFLELKSLFDISCSDEYIADFTNFSIGMVSKYSPMDVKKLVTVIEQVFSNRIFGIHLINLPTYAEALILFIRSCLKKKLRERFHFHKNHASLYKYFSKEMLPNDFGGDEKTTAELHADWMTFLDQQEEHFVKMQLVKVDETKRGKKLVNDEVLGFHGNFRKLDVD